MLKSMDSIWSVGGIYSTYPRSCTSTLGKSSMKRPEDMPYEEYRNLRTNLSKKLKRYLRGNLVYAHPLPAQKEDGSWFQPKRVPYVKENDSPS